MTNGSNKAFGNVERSRDFRVTVTKMHPNLSGKNCGEHVGVQELLKSGEEDI